MISSSKKNPSGIVSVKMRPLPKHVKRNQLILAQIKSQKEVDQVVNRVVVTGILTLLSFLRSPIFLDILKYPLVVVLGLMVLEATKEKVRDKVDLKDQRDQKVSNILLHLAYN